MSRMARLGSSRRAALHTAAHAASKPPPRRLRVSAAVVDVLGMAVAGAAAYHRVRVASPGALQRLGWRYEGGANGFTPAHQPLHRAGDAGGHDLKTTSWLHHTSYLHGPGQRMECLVSL